MKTVLLVGLGIGALYFAATGKYKNVSAAVETGDLKNILEGRGEKIILGLIAASLLLWLVEANAGETPGRWYVLVLVLGFVAYNRAALEIFARELNARLTKE